MSIFKSLKNINYKLFFSLLIMGLCPTIYTTVRVFILGQLPGEWAFSIAGQLSWINLLYEILNEAIILPLYFFMGKVFLILYRIVEILWKRRKSCKVGKAIVF